MRPPLVPSENIDTTKEKISEEQIILEIKLCSTFREEGATTVCVSLTAGITDLQGFQHSVR